MTTVNATFARRAMTRLSTPGALTAAEPAARPARDTGRRLRLSFPGPVDSRATRALLSADLRAGWAQVLDMAGLLAAATGLVALLGALCR
jgi:hypothetical protein